MHVLIKKLETLHTLTTEEKEAIVGALKGPFEVARGDEIVADGSMPEHSTVLLAGVACRHKDFEDGRRQILSFNYPGDLVDLYSYVMKRMDHGISAVCKCTTAHLPHASIEALSEQFPNLVYTLWRDTMVDTAISQNWLSNVGRRSAAERLAHFICEQFVRMDAVGIAVEGQPNRFPVTQTDIADATGLSLVHVNKRLQILRERGFIGRNPNFLEILDWPGIRQFAGFDPTYLHYRNRRDEDCSL